ncbi:MAG: hypothetical protein IH623_12640 [Verrucomicrobia bacterium]|nr:hypothetical protein [Verrucomicrobiota bacterium]
MKTKSVVNVIGLSPGIRSVTECALDILNYTAQELFAFALCDSMDLPSQPAADVPRRWSDLEAMLVEEKKRRRCEHLIGVLDDPIHNNWFSHAAYGKNVAWITTHNWEFYSNLSAMSFVAYDIVLNLVLMQIVTKPEDEAWLMGEVLHTRETRGCISDLCAYKPDISRKIRSGEICPDCRRILESRMRSEGLAAVETLLKRIRAVAIPNENRTPTRRFPEFSRMRKKAWVLLGEIEREGHDKCSSPERLASNKTAREVRHSLPIPCAHPSESPAQLRYPSVKFSGSRYKCLPDRPGLHDEVERNYPFPIAYCFRSMRAEMNPTDRWLILYELYTLIIRYVTFVLLSDRLHQGKNLPQGVRAQVQKLKFGSGGDWGRACVDLLRHLSGLRNAETDFGPLRDTFDGDKLPHFEGTCFDADILNWFRVASIDLVRARNRTFGHGFRGGKQDAQRLFDQHLPGVKTMLGLIAPLSEYLLFCPVQIIANVGGKSVYFSKMLMGSNPLFLTEQMAGPTTETVCQVLVPGREERTLSLHPWLHLADCNDCGRDMIFVYDSIYGDTEGERVVLREYPSNHEKHRPELVTHMKELLCA